MNTEQLKAAMEAAEAELHATTIAFNQARSRLFEAQHLYRASIADFNIGDIVADRLGKKYRITGYIMPWMAEKVGYEGKPLKKDGTPSQRDATRIYAYPITLVTPVQS